MYLEFYHLKQTPFHITPDPAFLFLSPSHKAALGAFVYGVAERQGFVMLLGEVGLGKTTIIRAYLERVDPTQLKVVYIFNPKVTFAELLTAMCQQCGVAADTSDVTDMVTRLQRVLVDEYNQGRNVALIVDEVQHMPVETLEQLRLLSNLETSTHKLIQIVLVGQPEFETKLEDPLLRSLRQRLVLRATLTPLTDEESHDYILERLAKVQTEPEPLFTKGALQEIIRHAQGTPRVLNILCTNALIQGAGYRTRRISARIVQDVIAAQQGRPRRRWVRRLMFASLLVLLAALIALSWWARSPAFLWSALELQRLVATATRLVPTTTPVPPSMPTVERDRPAPAATRAPEAVQTSVRSPEPPPPAAEPPPAPARSRLLKPGESLAKVAVEVYGFSNNAVLAWIQQHNPLLRDVKAPEAGLSLHLPPLPATTR